LQWIELALHLHCHWFQTTSFRAWRLLCHQWMTGITWWFRFRWVKSMDLSSFVCHTRIPTPHHFNNKSNKRKVRERAGWLEVCAEWDHCNRKG
jgi:hypothetical protein